MNKILYLLYCSILVITNNLCVVSGNLRPFLNTYVSEGEAPYIVYVKSIISGTEKKCTGTILDKNWVLTIASCVPPNKKEVNITVIANMNAYKQDSDNDMVSQTRSIHEAIVHPNYKPNKPGEADLALLKVVKPFEENEFVTSIGIDVDSWPLNNKKPTKRICNVIGYGDIDYTKRDNKLKTRRVQITHTGSCACARRNEWMQLACCDTVEDVGLCPEDDGAPLICKGKLVGVNHILLVKSNCSPPLVPEDICVSVTAVMLVTKHYWRRHVVPIRSRLRRHPYSVCRAFLHDLCSNLSLHGLAHIAQRDKLPCERILWAVLVFIASLGLSAVSYNTWHSFQHPIIVKTVLTTRYDCSNLPFPSFTVCDTSRVDWQKALKLTPRDIPNLGNGSMEKVLKLLQTLADITFGDFDLLEPLTAENITSSGLGKIDITNLLLKVQRSCSDVFISCWWREKYINCCTLFEVQRTDIGFCYSFNSDVSDLSESWSRGYGQVENNSNDNYWVDWKKVIRPRRTAASGPWNGLRIEVRTMTPEQLPAGSNITSGIMFYLEESRSFPNSENQNINPASFVDVRIHGITLHAQPNVRSLDFMDRLCLFPDERPGWNGVYKEHNCFAACQRDYAMKLCNCSPTFLFLDNDVKYPACDFEGLFCLKDNNDVFNTLAPNQGQEAFFDNQVNAMKCDCPPDCASQHYMFDTSISQIPDKSHIVFDVHYRGQNYNIVYTSQVSFDAMDFIVSIGGVAGLFLGGSLITGVEVIYFFTFRFFYHLKRARRVEHIPQTTIKHVYPYVY